MSRRLQLNLRSRATLTTMERRPTTQSRPTQEEDRLPMMSNITMRKPLGRLTILLRSRGSRKEAREGSLTCSSLNIKKRKSVSTLRRPMLITPINQKLSNIMKSLPGRQGNQEMTITKKHLPNSSTKSTLKGRNSMILTIDHTKSKGVISKKAGKEGDTNSQFRVSELEVAS